MTLLATPPPLIVDHTVPPPGSWERESSHFPAPLSPFTKSLMLMEHWSRQITAETGSLIETVRFIEIGGWVYMRPVPFGERPGAPTPPDWLVPLLTRLAPAIRRRIADARTALAQDWSGRQIDAWYDRRDDLAGRLAALRDANRTAMSDGELDEHLRAAIALGHECLDLHFRLHTALARDLRAFTVTCRELLGWDDGRSLSMLAGTSTASTAAARSLAGLAAMARRSDELARLVRTAPVDQVLAADPEFASAFAAHLDRFCCRAITYDVDDPILAERPELVLGFVRDQLDLGDRSTPLGDGSPMIDEARARLADASPAARSRFEERLAKALRAYPVREDNAYVTVCTPIALLRTVGLELGRRLVGRERLGTGPDVFLLHVDEARSALLEATPVRDLVDRRRRERQRTLARPGPQRYGPEPMPMPAVHRLPAPARQSVEDLLWLLDQVVPKQEPTSVSGVPGEVIAGTAASRGRATGTVRVVRGESEFGKLRAGDVLVCECTSPAWSIIFPSLSAVVTDSGGLLSHPAIVAREFGIPAVVATGEATSRLRDGQRVVVDGTAGTVRVAS